jgi:hypothetical protein
LPLYMASIARIPMKTRRQFVHLSLAALSISVLHPLHAQRLGGAVFVRGNVDAYEHGGLTQAVFERHVGSLFNAYLDDDKTASLRLTKVKPDGARAAKDGKEKLVVAVKSVIPMTAFSLVFDTGGVEIPQDSYLVDHGVLGRFAIFLVPGIATDGRTTCIAYFSSLKQA